MNPFAKGKGRDHAEHDAKIARRSVRVKQTQEKVDISKLCCCFQYAGDNPECKVHYPENKTIHGGER